MSIDDPMRGTPARVKDLLMLTHFVGCWNDFATDRTNTASVFEGFGQVGAPSLPHTEDSELDSLTTTPSSSAVGHDCFIVYTPILAIVCSPDYRRSPAASLLLQPRPHTPPAAQT